MIRACLGEFLGTFILVFFGVGSVHVAVLTGALAGVWPVASIWGAGVALAIYATASISGAHLNPAITAAMAMFRGFPLRRAAPYVAAQFVGAVAAAALLYALYGGAIAAFEAAHGLTRGAPGSELSAMMYGEYFPNPAVAAASPNILGDVSWTSAMLAEGVGTALLAFFVFAVTDRRNSGAPGTSLLPLMIGLAVAIIIGVIAPLTQAGLNPARDFGPRVVAYVAGWGPVAIPGPRGGFFAVYIVAPVVGALVGSAAYSFLLSPRLALAADAKAAAEQKGNSCKQCN